MSIYKQKNEQQEKFEKWRSAQNSKVPLISQEYLEKHPSEIIIPKKSNKSRKPLFLILILICGLIGYLTFKPNISSYFIFNFR